MVDLCMCINKRVELLFMWVYNRDKGILDWTRVLGAFGSRLTREGGDVCAYALDWSVRFGQVRDFFIVARKSKALRAFALGGAVL